MPKADQWGAKNISKGINAVKGKVAGALSSFSKGESKLPLEYNLQFFADRNAGNSKPLIPLNLQYFASEGKVE